MLGHVAELKTKLKLNLICFKKCKSMRIPRGLMARILGFHPRGPGSIPGVGEPLFDDAMLQCLTAGQESWGLYQCHQVLFRLAILDSVGTSFVQFEQSWSGLDMFEPNWMFFNQIWTISARLKKFDPISTSLNPIWTSLVKSGWVLPSAVIWQIHNLQSTDH